MKSLDININYYQEVLKLVKQLPKKEIEKLMTALQKEFSPKKKKKPENDLQQLILNAPTWSDKEYEDYKEGRKHLNKFRGR